MKVSDFISVIGSEFFTGVPDSQLKTLCDYLMQVYGCDGKHHVIAANEGNSVALAAGYYMATNKIPVVYLQNSGLGNIVNPVASLLNDRVYGIPVVFVVGWRGELGVHDEPQHLFQGAITERLLADIGIRYYILDENTQLTDLINVMDHFHVMLGQGKSVAFLVRKNGLTNKHRMDYRNSLSIMREDAIRYIVKNSDKDIIVATTGKTSRELFEIRQELGEGHQFDFLTVGSMGHSSSIALGLAMNCPHKRVWCIDGDGALLMHMGAMATIGHYKPSNLVHVVINNHAHESVGGMPTVSDTLNLANIGFSCGYIEVYSASTFEELDRALHNAKNNSVLTFMEIKCAIGARKNLGRPTATPKENLDHFMKFLSAGDL